MDGSRPRYETVEEIADHYCRQLAAMGLTGPFLLSGFSFGGLLAFEVATAVVAASGNRRFSFSCRTFPAQRFVRCGIVSACTSLRQASFYRASCGAVAIDR